jgi:hypothetical protein
MSENDTTEPKVFIIESLDFEDEDDGDFEGDLISKMLNLSRIEHKYFYIRTEQEFKEILNKFQESNYRYLHISCHGNSTSIGTTLNSIDFPTLAQHLSGKLEKKRLFLSACSAVNDDFANAVIRQTACYSVIGPHKTINFDDAAIFWASFYHLMFKQNAKAMKRDVLESTLNQLVTVHKMPLKYYSSSRSSTTGWKEVDLLPT